MWNPSLECRWYFDEKNQSCDCFIIRENGFDSGSCYEVFMFTKKITSSVQFYGNPPMFSQFKAYSPSSEEKFMHKTFTWQYGKVLDAVRLTHKVNFSDIHTIGRCYSVAHIHEKCSDWMSQITSARSSYSNK